MTRLSLRKETLRDLAVLSKNQCAFPGCDHPILDPSGVYIAELCHICAAEPGGQRYDPSQTDEDRRSAANLLFLCHRHHKETDNVSLFSAERLREIKRAHEALPEVVFNSELLLRQLEEIATEQSTIRSMLEAHSPTPNEQNFPISGPDFRENWTPEAGRFYETWTGPKTKFKYMMKDGWLHIEQLLEDGAIAYYEVNKEGNLRQTKLPYPLHEYQVIIPIELILKKEQVPTTLGTHAVRTTLKWSKGTVTEHFVGNLLNGLDFSAHVRVDQRARTITVG